MGVGTLPRREGARIEGATGSASAVAGRHSRTPFQKEEIFAAFLAGPALLVLVVTTTFPLVYLIWNSFQNINLAMPFMNGFAGLDNYTQMIADGNFWHSLELTAIYAISSVLLQVVIGLGLALLVMQIPRGQGVFRIVAILPIVLAPVVVGLFWRTLMLAPNFGIVDFAVKALGFGAVNWLGAPAPALISVIMIHTWQWTPFAFLVFLASLASLPPDVYEAARIDRAGPVQRFIHITLPLIRPALVIVVIMRSMIALSAFAAIFAATRGGPGTATEILNLYAYRTSFVELNFGYGSALAVALLVITLAVSGVLFALRTARVSQ
ncbi:carbohydrate ABC transporter permease [Mesorhizobium koreense]|uniref:carbohydrate ABC transporter permease n=1 Tax=Mesorhizobium koreense TaxID=3074855 RepID=UPI00287BBA74|nr:sugar ABC transporter permease [Mesorhizobium sp. WR6]